jgi:hypothetical protein
VGEFLPDKTASRRGTRQSSQANVPAGKLFFLERRNFGVFVPNVMTSLVLLKYR